MMDKWFTTEQIDMNTYVISEYKHWEETHCYLLNGTEKSLLIDTGMGIENIWEEVQKLTDKLIVAVATHTHWDHIGGHKYFEEFYVHNDEADWINGNFPLTLDYIKNLVIEEPCDLPKDFDLQSYEVFQGEPTRVLKDTDVIELGGRSIEVLHTPGHAPGHMCFYEKEKGYLFTGDLVYKGKLTAFFPTTDPIAYKKSIEKLVKLQVSEIFPAHHELDVPLSILEEINNAFVELDRDGNLKHGAGTFSYNHFEIQL